MADIEKLGVAVEQTGALETARALDQVTDSAKRAEASTQALRDASGTLSRAQQDLIRMANEIAAAVRAADGAELGRLNTLQEEIDRVRQLARESGNLALVNRQLADATAALAEKQAAATAAATAANPALAANAANLLAMAQNAAGIPPELAAITAAAGTVATALAAIGVIAAFSYIAKEVTLYRQELKAAQDEQEKLRQGLIRFYETKQKGDAGIQGDQLKAGQAAVALQEGKLADLKAQLSSPTLQGSEAGAVIADNLRKQIAEYERVIGIEKASIAAANDAIVKAVGDGTLSRRNAEAQALASLVGSNHATEAERARALQILKQDNEALAKASAPPSNFTTDQRTEFFKQRADLAQEAKALQDAFKPDLSPVKVVVDPAFLALEKLAAGYKDAYLQSTALARQADQASRLVGMEGVARDILTARFKAENEQAKVNATLSGTLLDEATRSIQTTYDQTKARLLDAEAAKDQVFAQKTLASAAKDANDTAAKNVKTTHDQLAEGLKIYDASNAAAQKLATTISRDLSQSLEQFASRGTRSFEDFFRVVESGAGRVANAIAQSIDRQNELLTQALRKGFDADASMIEDRIEELEKFKTLVGVVSAGATGAIAGYNIGSQTGSAAIGIVGGVATGAAAGSEFGPWGVAAGALLGAAGGLLGAADAHKKAAEEIREATKQLNLAVDKYGAKTSVESAITQDTIDYQALRAQALDTLNKTAGSKDQGPQYDAYNALNRLDQEHIEKQKQIVLDFFGSIDQQIRATQGAAGAYANSLEAIKKQHDDEIAGVNALAAAGKISGAAAAFSRQQIDELAKTQAAQAKAAYDAGQSQLRLSEDAREAAAKGLDAVSAAITRRAQEEDELFRDSQAGYTDAELARVKYIQGLEDERAALLRLTDATNTLNQNLAKGPAGTLADQQAADLAPLTQKRDADLAVFNDAFSTFSQDILGVTDPAKYAADYIALLTAKTTLLGDQAAITAATFAAAAAQMTAAQSAIQRDINLGFITPEKGRQEEAQAFGFGGLSDADIRALYTVFSGTPLSNEQEQTNKLIEQFFRDFPSATQSIADAVSKAQTTPNPADAVSYAAKSLTQVTGDRMAEYLATEVIYLREIRDAVVGRGTAFGPPSAFSNSNPFAGFTPPAVDFPSLSNFLQPASRGTAPAPQQIVVQGGGSRTVNVVVTLRTDDTSRFRIPKDDLREIAREVRDVIDEDAHDTLQRDGNPVIVSG